MTLRKPSGLGQGLGALIPSPAQLAKSAGAAEEFAERAEPRIWAWLNRHNAPWSPSDAKVRDLAYDLGTLAAPIGIPTPRLDEARRREDQRATFASLITDAGSEAIAALHAKIAEEDGRARSLLPDPPDGWEWEASLQSDAVGAHVLGEVVVRIVYRLREVTS